MPELLALEIETDQSAVAKEGHDALAVGHRRGAGEAVFVADVGFDFVRRRRAAPEQLAITATNAVQRAVDARLAGTGQENAIAPDDWRGVARSGNLDVPHDVLGLRPVKGQAMRGAVALPLRSAESRPLELRARGRQNNGELWSLAGDSRSLGAGLFGG